MRQKIKYNSVRSIVVIATLISLLAILLCSIILDNAKAESENDINVGSASTSNTSNPNANFLTFTAEEANSKVSFGWFDGYNVFYKKNDGSWIDITSQQGTSVEIDLNNVGDTVSFKASGIQTNSSNTEHFNIQGKVAASGSVTSLTDQDGSNPSVSLSDSCYQYMFQGCTGLTQAPELPATTLAKKCYLQMFDGCINLTKAPELPATALAENCYEKMFQGCTGLTQAPELPATTLTLRCYSSMFNKCTNLTKAPELPATTLANYCYQGMFMGCNNLAKAPELPATTLSSSGYYQMFQGCTSLTEAPKLPATTLDYYCYDEMFKDCTNLKKAPELPATTLANNCYYEMFQGCTSLTVAPELPATTLTSRCHYQMFQGCTSLIIKKDKIDGYQEWKIPATEEQTYWNTDMFKDCSGVEFETPELNTSYWQFSLDTYKNEAKQEIDDAALKAKKEINPNYEEVLNSSTPEEAEQEIDDTANKAKENIDAAKTKEEVDKAKADGLKAIEDAKNSYKPKEKESQNPDSESSYENSKLSETNDTINILLLSMIVLLGISASVLYKKNKYLS